MNEYVYMNIWPRTVILDLQVRINMRIIADRIYYVPYVALNMDLTQPYV